jgi:hypothetical protein
MYERRSQLVSTPLLACTSSLLPWHRCVEVCAEVLGVVHRRTATSTAVLPCSRTQIHTDFHRKLNKYREDQHQKWLNEMCLSLSSLNLTPAPSRKSSVSSSVDVPFSLSQESLESTVSNNSAATPTSFTSTVTDGFEESQRPLMYDADEESDKCPVFSCVKNGVDGVPCDKNVPVEKRPGPAATQPEAPSPIKRRRTSSMELDTKFQCKRRRFDSSEAEQPSDLLNTAFFYDSE